MKGKWTPIEHNKFLEALRIHGKDWDRISKYVGTRTALNTKAHGQKFFRKLKA
jgi:MYB-related transcription factor LHY